MPIKIPQPKYEPVDTFSGTTFISFGFDRRNAPRADIIIDVRKFLDSPHWSVDGLSEEYLQEVRKGYWNLIAELEGLLSQLQLYSVAPITIAIGCGQGRHRSPALAEILARHIYDTRVIHLDYRKPSEK